MARTTTKSLSIGAQMVKNSMEITAKKTRKSAKPSMAVTEQELAALGVHIPTDAELDAQVKAAQAEEATNLATEQAEMTLESLKPKARKEAQYTGPMLILRQRLKAGAYGKMANGQPACGDQLAQMLGALKPEQVIRACMIAMAFDSNPYAHLNVGQQSMNLRNKLRGMLKKGDFGYGVVNEAIEEVTEAVADTARDAAQLADEQKWAEERTATGKVMD